MVQWPSQLVRYGYSNIYRGTFCPTGSHLEITGGAMKREIEMEITMTDYGKS